MNKKIKKKNILKYSALICVCAFLVIMGKPNKAMADINGPESTVIGVAGSTFEYGGHYYKVKSSYINQLVNALDTNYNLTSSQANMCVDYIYNNVATGIASGYLYQVDTDSESNSQVTEGSNEKTEDKGIINESDINTQIKNKEEMLRDTTSLAAEMGVNISYDPQKEGMTVTDDSGNVIISMKNAVKNTGFKLNSVLIFMALLIACTIFGLVMAVKYRLFDSGDKDE